MVVIIMQLYHLKRSFDQSTHRGHSTFGHDRFGLHDNQFFLVLTVVVLDHAVEAHHQRLNNSFLVGAWLSVGCGFFIEEAFFGLGAFG